MSPTHEVIIAGAGPVGLMLACELALRGIEVLVLEKQQEIVTSWKQMPLGMRGLNTSSVEALYRRGLLDEFVTDPVGRLRALDQVPGGKRGGHFAGITIDSNALDLSKWKYRIPHHTLVPMPSSIEQVESVLAARAIELGVNIIRGNGVAFLERQDDQSVSVKAGDGTIHTCRWLVGCDGAHSAVRKSAGIEFVGTEASITAYTIDADIDNIDKLGMGFQPTETGLYIRLGPGVMHLLDFDGGKFERDDGIRQEHVQEVLNRITGRADVTIKQIHHSSAWTDRSKVARTYRSGRIFLAGDACHVHPPFGAQGLNAGIADSMNLSWKLATAVKAERAGKTVNEALLNSYEHERRPMAEAVIEYTRVQMVLIRPDPYGRASRQMVSELIQTKDGANYYLDKFWGLSHRYPPSKDDCQHDAVGRSAPNFVFADGSMLGEKLVAGKGLLLNLGSSADLGDSLDEDLLEDINFLSMNVENACGLGALLIRPDGVVAWAVDFRSANDSEQLSKAISKWFPR